MSERERLSDDDIRTTWRRGDPGTTSALADPDSTDADGDDSDTTDSDSDTQDS